MSEPAESKRNVLVKIAALCGLGVLPMLRSGVGPLLLGLPNILVCVGGMLLLNGVANFNVTVPFVGHIGLGVQHQALRYYAVAFFLAAIYQRRNRRQEFRQGIKQDGRGTGTSHFEFLSVLIPHEWIYRYMDGGVCVLAGYVVYHLGFTALGLCWMLGGLGLAITEAIRLEAEERELIEIHTQDFRAAKLAARMEGRQARAETYAPRPQAASGLNTGLDNGTHQRPGDTPQSPTPGAGIGIPTDRASKTKLAVLAAIILLAVVFYNMNPRAVAQIREPLRKATTVLAKAANAATPIPEQAPVVRPRPFFFAPPKPVPPVDPRPFHEVLGKWQGYSTSPRGYCNAEAEIDTNAAATEFTALVNFGCRPPRAAVPATRRVRGRVMPTAQPSPRCFSPVIARLSGKPVGPSVQFRGIKTYAVNTEGCSITSATVTSLGANRIALELTDDGGCGGGKLLLYKSRF